MYPEKIKKYASIGVAILLVVLCVCIAWAGAGVLVDLTPMHQNDNKVDDSKTDIIKQEKLNEKTHDEIIAEQGYDLSMPGYAGETKDRVVPENERQQEVALPVYQPEARNPLEWYDCRDNGIVFSFHQFLEEAGYDTTGKSVTISRSSNDLNMTVKYENWTLYAQRSSYCVLIIGLTSKEEPNSEQKDAVRTLMGDLDMEIKDGEWVWGESY